MTLLTRAGQAVRVLRSWHGPLAALAVLSAGLAVATILAWALDDRVLLGQPIWAKPLKFALSFALYSVALAWMISRLRSWRRTGWWAGTVLAIASAGELVVIVTQVVRGRASHFNVATPLDSSLFSVMGALVAVIYLCTLVVAVMLMFTDLGDRALTWGVRLGIVVTLAGLSVGFLMLGETPEQARVVAQGLTPTTVGAHAVGVADGGPGLPVVGWSTTGGDLRVAHFVGMHALQLLPLLALGLGALGSRRLDERTRVHAVWLAAVGYAGVVVLTAWQALRGEPLLAPSGLTLAAFAVLLLAMSLGAATVVRSARHASTPSAEVPASTEVTA
jgi:hypothetical protein